MIFIYSRQDKTESRDEIIREKNLIAILWSLITEILFFVFFFSKFFVEIFNTFGKYSNEYLFYISIRIIRTSSDPTDFFFFFFFILFVVIASNCNFYKTA